MKKLVFSVLCLLVVGSLAFADEAAKDKDKNAAADKTITGCLSGPNSEGVYVLKTAEKGSVEVGGDKQLKEHVGHEVKLTGDWTKSGSAIGENEAAEKKESSTKEKNERHFKVEKIEHVSDTCSMK